MVTTKMILIRSKKNPMMALATPEERRQKREHDDAIRAQLEQELNALLESGYRILSATPCEDLNGIYVSFVLYRPDGDVAETQETDIAEMEAAVEA